jgi:hypothetical protein
MARLAQLAVVVEPNPPPLSPLRTDIAAFIGRAGRGPAGVAQRVESWLEFERVYGGLMADAQLGWAVRAYFANGGELAYITRVVGPHATAALGCFEDRGAAVTATATSPGSWANGAQVSLSRLGAEVAGAGTWYARTETAGGWSTSTEPLSLSDEDEPVETSLAIIDADTDLATELATMVGRRSPQAWTATLVGGDDGGLPTVGAYRSALSGVLSETEVSLVALPDAWQDLGDEAITILGEALDGADATLDRLVLVDLPPLANESAERAVRAARDIADALAVRATGLSGSLRAGAAYHPWLVVVDETPGVPPGTTRVVPPCGHVAGLASRLDRERGAARSPANADLADVVDVAQRLDRPHELAVIAERVNLVRCSPGRSIQVWGARSLDPSPSGRFVAHRRLTHRLVRAMRRVAEPMVFEPNAAELRFALRRAVTTVLLQAYRTGALAGATPAEAFIVRCDDTTTTAEDVDAGRIVCEVSFVPANPMELITIRLLLAPEGRLEVIER